MAVVRDPAFWRRFSIAVHQDEELQRPGLEHSYVKTLSSPSSSSLPSPASPAPTPHTTFSPLSPTYFQSKSCPDLDAAHFPSQHPGAQVAEEKPLPRPIPVYSSNRRTFSSLTLGLSGRPNSRFKVWTSVTADPTCRHSWLEKQQQKKRRVHCLCWVGLLLVLVAVAAVIVTILLLRSRNII